MNAGFESAGRTCLACERVVPSGVPRVMPKLFRSPECHLILLPLSLQLAVGCTVEVSGRDATGGGSNVANTESKSEAPDTSTQNVPSSQDVGSSSQTNEDASTSEAPTNEQGEPTPEGSTTEEGLSTESSPEGEDDGNQGPLCSDAGNDHHCAPVAPAKWFGPVSLAQAQSAKELRDCDAHGAAVEELFDDVTGAPAECVGCRERLGLPEDDVAQLVKFGNDGCSRDYIEERINLNRGECIRVPRWNAGGREPYWGFRFAPRGGRVTCKPTNPKPRVPEAEKNSFFRGCRVEREGRCEAPGTTCVQTGQAPACVYRSGSHDCPAEYNEKRTMLYAGVSDTRGCSECRVEFQNGHLEPTGRVGFYEGSSCAERLLREEIQLRELVGHCRSDRYRKESGWFYIRSEPGEPEFTGSCLPVGWEPEGSIKKTDPVTLCCARVN